MFMVEKIVKTTDTKRVECKRCGNIWETKSKEWRLTCSVCGTSVAVQKPSLEVLKEKAKTLNIKRGFRDESK
jgi:predicted  nucleic acid-binding Zn-ribbon protein